MTLYEKKIKKLQAVLHKKQDQINKAIAIKNYVDRNFESDLNLDELSEVQFLSKYHLIRQFKKYYGLTPRQYLIDRRIEKSKEHLATGMSVTQTCVAVGFSSLGSFSSLFKTKTEKTPAQYQKEQLSRNTTVSDS